MKKKLLTLAVAAAVAVPALASAEAIMYGKIHQSIDYQDVDYAPGFAPLFNNSGTLVNPATDVYVTAAGAVALAVPAGTTLTAAQQNTLAAAGGAVRVAPGQTWGGQSFKGWGISRPANGVFQGESRANRLGVKGSEDLGNGLKAIYQVELGIEFASGNGNTISGANNGLTFRNSFVGLAGNWGTFLVGRHDTPLKMSTGKLDLFSDTMADYNGTVGFNDIRANSVVAYVSPSFSGVQFLAAAIAGSSQSAGLGTNINSDSLAEGYSLGLVYSNGPFYASAAYESVSEQLMMNSATSLSSCGTLSVGGGTISSPSCAFNFDDNFTKWRLGLGLLDWNGFTLTGIYEHQDLPTWDNFGTFTGAGSTFDFNLPGGLGYPAITGNGSDSADLWQIQAGYSFGNIMLKAMYGQTDRDGSFRLPAYGSNNESRYVGLYNQMAKDLYKGSRSTWAVGADYNFSKRTKAYLLYTSVSDDQSGSPNILFVPGSAVAGNTGNTDWDGFSLGIVHSF